MMFKSNHYVLYTLNLYNVIFQLYLDKTGKKIKKSNSKHYGSKKFLYKVRMLGQAIEYVKRKEREESDKEIHL